MGKRVYISADYDEKSGDREVTNLLCKWGEDSVHKVDFVDTAKVASGSVAKDEDCRICDLKEEFNRQINASSIVIFVVGDKTANRTAGKECYRANKQFYECQCTPYKKNSLGAKPCTRIVLLKNIGNNDYDCINSVSYLRHEFEEAVCLGKSIIILYNSLNKQENWLPSYMKEYKDKAYPFWIKNESDNGKKVGNYTVIKQALENE